MNTHTHTHTHIHIDVDKSTHSQPNYGKSVYCTQQIFIFQCNLLNSVMNIIQINPTSYKENVIVFRFEFHKLLCVRLQNY